MAITLNGDGIISGVSSISNPSDITVGTGASVFSPAANTLALGTNGSERVRVDSSGRLGIGTVTPESLFHVNGDATAIRITRGSSIGFLYNTGTSLTSTIRLQGNDGPAEIYTNATQPVLFSAGGSEKARILPTGGITFNGDTAAANALDDYEEGTWTPVISDGTNNATMNSGGGISRYTKIGNQVTCVVFVATTSLGSVSGSIRVTGLPFTNGPQYCTVTCGWAEFLNITAGHSLGGWIPQNGNHIQLTIWSQSVGTANLTATEWSSDGGAMFAFSYLTS